MENPEVSVIVAVYNAEKYIKNCLDSLLEQTFQNFEAVCIDDCSRDSSYEILLEYTSKDNRIKSFKQEVNQGQGILRNRALDIARGKYVMFLDSDDWFEPETIEKAYNQIIKNQNDLVVFDYYVFNSIDKSKKLMKDLTSPFSKEKDNPKIDIRQVKFNFGASYPCMAIYNKTFLDNNVIRFANARLCEDNIFCNKAMINSNSISILEEGLYNYRRNTESSSFNENLWEDSVDSNLITLDYVLGHKERSVFLPKYIPSCINSVLFFYNRLKNKKNNKEYYKRVREIFLKINSSCDVSKIEADINYKAFFDIVENCWEKYLIKNFLSNFSVSKKKVKKANAIELKKQIKKLEKKYKGKQVIIYGTGLAFQEVVKNYDLFGLNIIGVSDIKYTENQEGEKDLGYKIIPLNKIKDYKPHCIIIAVEKFVDIEDNFKNYIFKNAGIKICSLFDI